MDEPVSAAALSDRERSGRGRKPAAAGKPAVEVRCHPAERTSAWDLLWHRILSDVGRLTTDEAAATAA
jgi:hypothetical protein